MYRFLFSNVKKIIPKISETEMIALKSGTTSIDRMIFKGKVYLPKGYHKDLNKVESTFYNKKIEDLFNKFPIENIFNPNTTNNLKMLDHLKKIIFFLLL